MSPWRISGRESSKYGASQRLEVPPSLTLLPSRWHWPCLKNPDLWCIRHGANFRMDFTLANTESIHQTTIHQTTVAAAGYHGTNAAIVTPGPPIATAANAAINVANANSPAVTVEGGTLHYCWTHGLSPNANHSSNSCNHNGDDHINNATIFNMQGGSTRINMTRPVHWRLPDN
jgi:hypothetical protein